MKLLGKVSLVTGGGRGIGEGIAICLAEEGSDVAIADIELQNAQSVAGTIQKLGRKTLALHVDVTKWASVENMVQETIKGLGHIDILVTGAGVVSLSPLEDLKEEEWDRVMNVNAKGTFLCSKAVIRHMKQQGSGKIINIASLAGKRGTRGIGHYCASKFAVIGFMNTLAKELAKDNITVNAICPGHVRTYMWDYLSDARKLPGETREESWQRQMMASIPQGRPQTPRDMGDLAVYLATADSVTGQAINVNGGAELH